MRRRPNDRVAILAYDQLCTFEFGIAVELFALPRPELGGWYETVVCAADPGPLRATGGVTVQPTAGLDDVADAGTVVVPGWHDHAGPLVPAVAEALVACVVGGGRVFGICSGAFALAQAGLLDGRRATTHWAYAAELGQRFPRVRVELDALYVDAGAVLTSAGSAAGIDAGLHLVREDRGAELAAAVARRLVMAPHRDGGQTQYATPSRGPTERGAGDAWLGELQSWVHRHLDEPLGVGDLASHASMSTRTLTRRFASSVGVSPGAWLTRQRVDRALELLAATDLPVERVAVAVGLSSGAALRHHVRRQLGTTPSAYRRRFASTG